MSPCTAVAHDVGGRRRDATLVRHEELTDLLLNLGEEVDLVELGLREEEGVCARHAEVWGD